MDSKAQTEFVLGISIDYSTYQKTVYIRSGLFLASGGFTFSGEKFAPFFFLLSLIVTVTFMANPLLPKDNALDRTMNLSLLIKMVTSLSSVILLLLTKGKIVSEGARIKFVSDEASTQSHRKRN